MKKFIEKNFDTLLIIIGVIIFVLVNTYKLTNAGLWFDEVVEYWYSKGGTLPMGLTGSGGFFDRVRSTYQPPLYNMLMFLWLKIMDTEFWFRFFGVVAGAIGMIFLYKSCRLITKWFPPNATNRCANRWSLFCTPLIIMLMVILLNDFYMILQKVKFNNINIGHVFFGCVLTFVIMYSYINFFYHIQNNWGKGNIRGAVQYYLEDDKEKEGRVLVHVDSRQCFAFYMTHIGNQTVENSDSDKYVICSATNLEKIKEQLADFNINDKVIYLFGRHGYSDSVNKEYIKYFNERGYKEEIEPINGVCCTKFIKK